MVNRYKPKEENVKKLMAFLKKEESSSHTKKQEKKLNK